MKGTSVFKIKKWKEWAVWEVKEWWAQHVWHWLFSSSTCLSKLLLRKQNITNHITKSGFQIFPKKKNNNSFSSKTRFHPLFWSMASRRRMLLKVIILGDSGYASFFSFQIFYLFSIWSQKEVTKVVAFIWIVYSFYWNFQSFVCFTSRVRFIRNHEMLNVGGKMEIINDHIWNLGGMMKCIRAVDFFHFSIFISSVKDNYKNVMLILFLIFKHLYKNSEKKLEIKQTDLYYL